MKKSFLVFALLFSLSTLSALGNENQTCPINSGSWRASSSGMASGTMKCSANQEDTIVARFGACSVNFRRDDDDLWSGGSQDCRASMEIISPTSVSILWRAYSVRATYTKSPPSKLVRVSNLVGERRLRFSLQSESIFPFTCEIYDTNEDWGSSGRIRMVAQGVLGSFSVMSPSPIGLETQSANIFSGAISDGMVSVGSTTYEGIYRAHRLDQNGNDQSILMLDKKNKKYNVSPFMKEVVEAIDKICLKRPF